MIIHTILNIDENAKIVFKWRFRCIPITEIIKVARVQKILILKLKLFIIKYGISFCKVAAKKIFLNWAAKQKLINQM